MSALPPAGRPAAARPSTPAPETPAVRHAPARQPRPPDPPRVANAFAGAGAYGVVAGASDA